MRRRRPCPSPGPQPPLRTCRTPRIDGRPSRGAAPCSIPCGRGRSFPVARASPPSNKGALIASGGSLELAVAPDQRVGRTIVLELGFRRTLKLWDDPLGESLAQLDAPLIERIDLPDRALSKDAMLVESDQLAQGGWCQGIQQYGVRGTITLKQPVGHEPVRRAFRLDLLGSLAEGQRLRLGEDIGKQHVMVSAHR